MWDALIYALFGALSFKIVVYLALAIGGSIAIYVWLESHVVLAFLLMIVYVAGITLLWRWLGDWLD